VRHRKLTDAQIEQVQLVLLVRKTLPTAGKIAKQLGVSKRTIDKLSAAEVPSQTTTMLQRVLLELGCVLS
jgi:hypothetical protein